jgi:peptidoglycan/LPS O-acetylase OafA/YrhL
VFIPQLIFTRFLFALFIVIYHFGLEAFPFNLEVVRDFFNVPRNVTYFFLLSGFMLTIGHSEKINSISLRRYFVGRIARIYPVFLLGFVLALPYFIYKQPQASWIAPIIANLFLVQAWFPQYVFSINPPGWSISALVFFYALFPFILHFFMHTTRTKAATCTGLIWIVSVVANAIVLETFPGHQVSLATRFLFFGPLLHLNAFILGIFSAVVFKDIAMRIDQKWSFILVTTSLVTTSLIILSVSSLANKSLQNGLLGPVFVLLLYGLAGDKSWISRILVSKPCILLGELSYCLFMLQVPVMIYTLAFINRLHLPISATGRFYIILGALTVSSFVAYHLIEKPAKRAIQRIFANDQGSLGGNNLPIA